MPFKLFKLFKLNLNYFVIALFDVKLCTVHSAADVKNFISVVSTLLPCIFCTVKFLHRYKSGVTTVNLCNSKIGSLVRRIAPYMC